MRKNHGDSFRATGTALRTLVRWKALPQQSMNLNQQRTGREWDQIAARADFQALLASKMRFVIPAFIFFVTYYFALPVLVGYFPQWMNVAVGPVNLAYLFALSQFFVAWFIAWLYLRAADRWDGRAREILRAVEPNQNAASKANREEK